MDRASEVEEHLWQLAAPGSLDEFLASVSQWDAARIDLRLEQIEDEYQQAMERIEGLLQLVTREGDELAQYDTRDAAVRAAEEEPLLAALRRQSLRYARAQVAATALDQAIERYRTRNQGPILEEASRIVERLTGGSLERLIADYDEEQAVLVGVRPDGKVVRH